MCIETTPQVITKEIKELCNSIVYGCRLQLIQVYPFDGMEMSECFKNVDKVIDTLGGKAINGWAIWQWGNIMVEAEAHAIWSAPDGKLIDVTPHTHSEQYILFLQDERMKYEGNIIPSHRKALTESPLVRELIELCNERDIIMANSIDRMSVLPINQVKRILEIQQTLHRKVEPNELCNCGSGVKYKKCCGKYE